MSWLKLHSDIKDHVSMLELDDHQFRIWIHLLAMANESSTRGTVAASRQRSLAAALRTTPDAMEEAFKLFEDIGLISRSNETISINSWDQRQYRKPAESPDRTRERKQRSRTRKSTIEDGHTPVTPLSHSGHNHQNRTEQNREEKNRAEQTPPSGGAGGESVCEKSGTGERGATDRQTSTPEVALETAREILAVYPRQASLGPGIAAVAEQLQQHDAGLVLERTRQYAAAVATMPKRFVPYPARWYSEQRFLENPAEWTTATKQPVTWFTREEVHRMRDKDPGVERRLECWEHEGEWWYRHPTPTPAPAGYKKLYAPPTAHGPPENGTSTNGAPPVLST